MLVSSCHLSNRGDRTKIGNERGHGTGDSKTKLFEIVENRDEFSVVFLKFGMGTRKPLPGELEALYTGVLETLKNGYGAAEVTELPALISNHDQSFQYGDSLLHVASLHNLSRSPVGKLKQGSETAALSKCRMY